ncbi:MAG: PadR family transcriptional regulator [Patescibacteria group bacterium]
MDTQLKKGVLEMCVLTVLERKDCYGYELVSDISKTIAISEGTIYPLLRRLKNEEYVDTYLQESTDGPPRKYYRLTKKGKVASEELLKEWKEFNININQLLGEFKK